MELSTAMTSGVSRYADVGAAGRALPSPCTVGLPVSDGLRGEQTLLSASWNRTKGRDDGDPAARRRQHGPVDPARRGGEHPGGAEPLPRERPAPMAGLREDPAIG